MVNALTTWQFDSGDRDVELHQALHGYAEGHRLLESSIAIPDDLRRLMLRLSDLSGMSMVASFQDYLTGYPLPSLGAYALAKTWYASEMPRPGCVWTHTVIIPAGALNRMSDLSVVRRLFKRPGDPSAKAVYSQPIPFSLRETAADHETTLNESAIMRGFLAAHYSRGGRPLVLAATSSDEFTDLIFAAWSQKWPALRMRFTFCTGALSARTIDKRPLDVQCAPISLARQVAREISSEGFGELVLLQQASPNLPTWTALAADDALQREGGAFRKFLWGVSRTDSGQVEFERFGVIYEALLQSAPALIVLERTAELFPQATDGEGLKAVLFGDREEWGLPAYDVQELACAVATTEHYVSFTESVSSLQGAVARLMVEEPKRGCTLMEQLISASLNPLGEETLTVVILAMTVEAALVGGRAHPEYIPMFFRANPKLACSAELWSIAGDHRREAFEGLLEADLTDRSLKVGIINALLDSGSEGFIGSALLRWGVVAVFQVLEWIDAHDGTMTETYRTALSRHLDDVMAWVHNGEQKSAGGLVAAARVVAPSTDRIREGESTIWLGALQQLRNARMFEDAEYMMAFVLALGLCDAQPAPLDLVAESFESLHMVAERNHMRDSVWSILQPFVPELGWRKNWDKCERMRRGLVAAFVRYSWPTWELRRLIRDEELIRQILKSARKTDAEYYFRDLQ